MHRGQQASDELQVGAFHPPDLTAILEPQEGGELCDAEALTQLVLVFIHIDEITGHRTGFRHLLKALLDSLAGPAPFGAELQHGVAVHEAALDLLGAAAADMAVAAFHPVFDGLHESKVACQNALPTVRSRAPSPRGHLKQT